MNPVDHYLRELRRTVAGVERVARILGGPASLKQALAKWRNER